MFFPSSVCKASLLFFFRLSFASGDYQSLQNQLSHCQSDGPAFSTDFHKEILNVSEKLRTSAWLMMTNKIGVRSKRLSLQISHKITVRANVAECIGTDWESQGEVPWSTTFKAKLLDVLRFQWNLGNSKQNTLLAYWPAGWPSQITLQLRRSHLIAHRTNKH